MSDNYNNQSTTAIRGEIIGIGSYLPIQSVQTCDLLNEANSQKFGIDKYYIEKKIGIHSIRMADSAIKPSDLAAKATIMAINQSNIKISDIDTIIFCGMSKDDIEPGTGMSVAHKIGAVHTHTFDISNACHGFLDGLIAADNAIRSGRSRLAVICTGETTSRMIRSMLRTLQKKTVYAEQFSNMLGFLTLSDGAGAVVMQASSDPKVGLNFSHTRSDGSYSKLCHYDFDDEGFFTGQMCMKEISQFYVQYTKDTMERTYQALQWEKSEVDHVICHQVGKFNHEMIIRTCGINREQVPESYKNFGNLTTSTLPFNLSRLNFDKPYSNVLGFGAGSGAILTQFGLTIKGQMN